VINCGVLGELRKFDDVDGAISMIQLLDAVLTAFDVRLPDALETIRLHAKLQPEPTPSPRFGLVSLMCAFTLAVFVTGEAMCCKTPAYTRLRRHARSISHRVSRAQAAELTAYLALSVGSGAALALADRIECGWLLCCFIGATYMFLERVILTILLEDRGVLSLLPPRTQQLKRMYERGWTRISIFWLLAAATNRDALEPIYSLAACNAPVVLITFHAVLLLDRSSHQRLATHVGLPLSVFSAGNLIVHGLPAAMALAWPPQQVAWWHGAVVAAAHLAWGAAHTGGTLLLDDVYAPLPAFVWRVLWVLTVCCELLAPLAFRDVE